MNTTAMIGTSRSAVPDGPTARGSAAVAAIIFCSLISRTGFPEPHSLNSRRMSLPLVLVVCDVLQPLDRLISDGFLDGDVGDRRCRRGPAPVLHARRDADDVAGLHLLHFAAPLLLPAPAGGQY